MPAVSHLDHPNVPVKLREAVLAAAANALEHRVALRLLSSPEARELVVFAEHKVDQLVGRVAAWIRDPETTAHTEGWEARAGRRIY